MTRWADLDFSQLASLPKLCAGEHEWQAQSVDVYELDVDTVLIEQTYACANCPAGRLSAEWRRV